MDKLITVSPSPHVHSGQSVSKLMYWVIIAMLPAFAVSVYFFGIGAIYLTLLSVASCVFFEYIIQKYLLKTPVRTSDGSAIVTGMLLAFNLPSGLPPFIVIVGALVAIGIGKMTFGGLGNNPFNPALVGRVFLLLSFPTRMTKYPVAEGFGTPMIIPSEALDASTGATPLGIIKEGIKSGDGIGQILQSEGLSYTDLFTGNIGGSLGEIAASALLIGFAILLIKKVITWHIPVSVMGTVLIFTGILWLFGFEGHQIVLDRTGISLPLLQYTDKNTLELVPFHMADPLFHLLTGGLILGAVFMATDYVTSPMTSKGQLIFGVGIGIITVLIRVFGAYPEGVSFAILIMNGFTPLINRYVKPRRFGKI
ncbi:MAG: RnfABCDGE type electron transport complex subunit D [Bacteroidales bacterium]|nr:RnfABCDGE type electron transport complex subunit D [Bacteroidales bacterium]